MPRTSTPRQARRGRIEVSKFLKWARGDCKRLRADYMRPRPAGLITSYYAWLESLRDEFGPEEMAKWGHVRFGGLGTDILTMHANGARFSAERHGNRWRVYRGGRAVRRTRTLPPGAPVPAGWALAKDGTHVTARCLVDAGERIGTARDVGEVEILVKVLAPQMPPAGWRFEDFVGAGARVGVGLS